MKPATPTPAPDLVLVLEPLPASTPGWTLDDTQAYLTANPLPPDFCWRHRDYPADQPRPVHPSHQTLKGGYGKWLRETPYFPGLFERVHGLILEAGYDLPDPATLAARLRARYSP